MSDRTTESAPATPTVLPPGVHVRGVRASYGRIEVLHGVDLEVPAGSVFALLGPNGAGKSTLLKVMSGRMRPSAGEVVICDTPIGKTSAEKLARQGVCAVPEGRGIFPNLTVRENLRIWTYRGGITMKEVEDHTYETFPVLKERRRQLAGTMSGGEQQMLAIGRILRTGAKLLLLDEPTEGLAPVIVQQIGRTIRAIKERGFTVLLVEQNFHFAATVADRHYVMDHGVVIDQINNSELAANMDKLHDYLGV